MMGSLADASVQEAMGSSETKRRRRRERAPEDWMSVAEAAGKMGISKTTLYDMINAGDFPAVQVTPDLRRVRPEDIKAWGDRNVRSGAGVGDDEGGDQ